MPGRTTARAWRSRLSKLREYCNAIAVPGYRITSVTRDAPGERRSEVPHIAFKPIGCGTYVLFIGCRSSAQEARERWAAAWLFRRCRTISGDPEGESAESSERAEID